MTEHSKDGLMAIQEEMLSLAARNGLEVKGDTIHFNESGMDFRVAFASDEQGQKWVLRQPRREDVWERAENERRVLDVVRAHLHVDVPDWRVCTPELIAYPLLDGEPVAVVDPAGAGYAWRFPQDDLHEVFFDTLAGALVALHNIDPEDAIRGGVRRKTPAEARQAFASNMEEVKASFDVSASLAMRWQQWITDDRYWPDHSTFNHGDLHPPHILVDESQRVTGLIDWTEAEIADPGKDFVILYGLFGDEVTRDLLARYERVGGRTWPYMFEHIREQWVAYPALVAKFALITGREPDMEFARSMLAQWTVN